jgi:hypothetical protein
LVAYRAPPPSEPANRWFFSPERDRADGTLDRIVVEFDAAVIEESGEGWPACERITNGLGGWNAAKLHLEPGLHHLDERPGAGVTNVPTGARPRADARIFLS